MYFGNRFGTRRKMPRKANTDLRQALLKIDIRKKPHVVRGVVELLDTGVKAHSITTERYRKTIGDTIHLDAVRNIEEKADLIKDIFRDFDSATPVAEISDANNEKDLADLEARFEDARIKGGIETVDESRADPLSPFRLLIAREAEAKVPYEQWTLHYLRTIGFSKEKALALVQEYDSLSPRRIRAEVRGDTPRLAKFRSWERWLDMHYYVYLRAMAPQIPDAYLRCAVSLVSKGAIDANSHLGIAGNGIARYAIWEGDENKNAFYESLRVLNSNSRRHNSFVQRIKNMIEEEEKNG